MAAFIITIQGTVSQAVSLGLSATPSHTAVVWVVALAGQHAGQEWGSEATNRISNVSVVPAAPFS
jgi:nickel/cobalt exporter